MAPAPPQRSRTSRRVGYAVAAVLNLLLVWVAHRIDEWWGSLFTETYDEVVPWITGSLLATAVANVTWFVRDPPWWRHLAQIGLDAVTVVVAGRIWDVFPFDVDGAFRLGVRALLVVAIAGAVIGIAVEAGRLVRAVVGLPRAQAVSTQ